MFMILANLVSNKSSSPKRFQNLMDLYFYLFLINSNTTKSFQMQIDTCNKLCIRMHANRYQLPKFKCRLESKTRWTNNTIITNIITGYKIVIFNTRPMKATQIRYTRHLGLVSLNTILTGLSG